MRGDRMTPLILLICGSHWNNLSQTRQSHSFTPPPQDVASLQVTDDEDGVFGRSFAGEWPDSDLEDPVDAALEVGGCYYHLWMWKKVIYRCENDPKSDMIYNLLYSIHHKALSYIQITTSLNYLLDRREDLALKIGEVRSGSKRLSYICYRH